MAAPIAMPAVKPISPAADRVGVLLLSCTTTVVDVGWV